LYRVFVRLGCRKKVESTKKQSKHLGHYETPKELGKKWQMDVKYVPKICYVGAEKSKDIPRYSPIVPSTTMAHNICPGKIFSSRRGRVIPCRGALHYSFFSRLSSRVASRVPTVWKICTISTSRTTARNMTKYR